MEEQAITNFYLKTIEEPPVPPEPVPVPDHGSGFVGNMIQTGDFLGLLILVLFVFCLCIVLFFLMRAWILAIRRKGNKKIYQIQEDMKKRRFNESYRL